ncbi:hypothetical protein IYW40_09135 [Methylocystis sp. H4A]|uniref:hypothetical protein n=1 Tax=Methylocystis sp. H4A TaxID=2785788 RepID=UPI0018C25FFD|nr:hypothetical protein [Methylocystis sp. H4A]MBG0801647.1 hypothetical protein [Methylocystis sp. H4A]
MKIAGPLDPRPLTALAYGAPPSKQGTEGFVGGVTIRAGYSIAEAASLLGYSNDELQSYISFTRMVECFAAWGTTNGESWHRPIRRRRWLEAHNVETSELIEKTTRVHWLNVRLIPPIVAPNVHEFVDGLTFKEAFWRIVISEPETGVAYNEALSVAPSVGKFVRSLCIYGPDHILKIPGTLSASSLSPSLLPRQCSNYLSAACAEAEEEDVRLGIYPNLIGRNTTVLLVLLGAGEILSAGFYKGDTRERIPIDPVLWTRSEYAIDLRKGDLVNAETGETEWSGIMLLAPKIDVNNGAEENHQRLMTYSAVQKINGAGGGKKSGAARKENRSWVPHARELAVAITDPEKRKNKSTLAKEICDSWKLEEPPSPTTRTLENFVDELIEDGALAPFDTKRSRFASETKPLQRGDTR